MSSTASEWQQEYERKMKLLAEKAKAELRDAVAADETVPKDGWILVDYAGGNDEGYINGVRFLHPDGREGFNEGRDPFSEDFGYEVVEAHFGHFSGAGDGTEYGGTIAYDVVTGETMEISQYSYERVDKEPFEGDTLDFLKSKRG